MHFNLTHLAYSNTGFFSALVNDYLKGSPFLQDFYTYTPDPEGINKAIAERSKFSINRERLANILEKQYEALPASAPVQNNIASLRREHTYTICTAHQPNLMTGYLYFIYKIVHAIKLAEELNKLHPDKHFVPVYYMGSEDNDLDELGTFRYEDKKFVWNADGQSGAVGRMTTASLKDLINDLFKVLGPPGKNLEELKKLITTAYVKHPTISSATQYLVHELFGQYGLIVLNPDEGLLKKSIIPILKNDLTDHTPYKLATACIDKLSAYYKAQAHPRQINLFYLADNIRERIERAGGRWQVVNTEIEWTEDELLAELEAHPERFSPNVILRGLFQEAILPNIAFIGGGAEVAYWLQLKPLFDYFNIFYPVVLLRQSVMWANAAAAKLRKQLGLSIDDIFQDEADLVKRYIMSHSGDNWQTGEEAATTEKLLQQLKQKAVALDPTLRSSAEAALTKIKHQLQVLEKKMYRAEKRKMQTELGRINKLKRLLFPNNSLQERYENFLPYYLQYGKEYIAILKDSMQPLETQFLIIEEAPNP